MSLVIWSACLGRVLISRRKPRGRGSRLTVCVYACRSVRRLAILRGQKHILLPRDLARIVNEVVDEVVGLGPIEFLLKGLKVTEVMGTVVVDDLNRPGFSGGSRP